MPMRTAEEGGQGAKITGRGFSKWGSDDAKLVEARPQVFRTPSIAGCPIIARDLLPEANIHAYTPSEASTPSQASNIIRVG